MNPSSNPYSIFAAGLHSRLYDPDKKQGEDDADRMKPSSARERNVSAKGSSKMRKKRPSSANPTLRVSPGQNRIAKVIVATGNNRSVSPTGRKGMEPNTAALLSLERYGRFHFKYLNIYDMSTIGKIW